MARRKKITVAEVEAERDAWRETSKRQGIALKELAPYVKKGMAVVLAEAAAAERPACPPAALMRKCSPLNALILSYMWDKDEAEEAALAAHVWGDERGDTITTAGIKSAIHRFNNELDLPFKLARERGQVVKVR